MSFFKWLGSFFSETDFAKKQRRPLKKLKSGLGTQGGVSLLMILKQKKMKLIPLRTKAITLGENEKTRSRKNIFSRR